MHYGRGIVQRVVKVTQICNHVVPGSSPGRGATGLNVINAALAHLVEQRTCNA